MLHDGVLLHISSQLCVDRYSISFKYVTMTEFIPQKPVNPRSQGTTSHSPGERQFLNIDQHTITGCQHQKMRDPRGGRLCQPNSLLPLIGGGVLVSMPFLWHAKMQL